ncbi:MAG: thermonuclease family protein [Verrucomicrobia bacterium]|nr:thermonuclease family protein [Verrucomicrobiota bacterium]
MKILFFVFLAWFCSNSLAHSITGTVSRVIDGDTIVVTSHSLLSTAHDPQTLRIRLADIDAPELKQAYGPEAREYLRSLVEGELVRVEYKKRDRYGRILGNVYIGSRYINLAMTATGHAWRYRYARKTGSIAEAESDARESRMGLWHAATPMAPWVFRRYGAKKETANRSIHPTSGALAYVSR